MLVSYLSVHERNSMQRSHQNDEVVQNCSLMEMESQTQSLSNSLDLSLPIISLPKGPIEEVPYPYKWIVPVQSFPVV